MEEKDHIKELFAEKLGNQEAQVNPELWTSIVSKIPATIGTSAVSSSLTSSAKFLITLGISAAVTVVTLLVLPKEDSEKNVASIEQKNEISEYDNDTNSNEISTLNQTKISFSEQISEHKTKTSQASDKNKEVSEQSLKSLEEVNKSINSEKNNEIIPVQIDEVKNINPIDQIIPTNSEQNVLNNTIVDEKASYYVGELPNVFTPNNDGNNDYFSIEIKGLSDFSLTILNKDNKRVFSTDNIHFTWNGNDFSNQLVEQGSYIYFFTGKDQKGNTISKSSVLKVHY